MRMPTAAELLTAWELGMSRPPLHRALTLLASACPDATDEQLWSLPVGERDARLLEMRERLFGTAVSMVASCPACAQQLESTVDLNAVRDVLPPVAPAEQVLDVGAHRVRVRMPSSVDVARTLAEERAESRHDTLLDRCIVGVHDDQGASVSAGDLPAQVRTALIERMAQADPRADLQFELVCPACSHRWSAPFDIASFLWKEVHAWAQRTLRDVHRLARSYGWSESEALALSPTRRHIYLELCRP
jgi:hypothetical protein